MLKRTGLDGQYLPNRHEFGVLNLPETLTSLNFASRIRNIELGPAKKQVHTVELHKTKQMVSFSCAFS
jgi:hypothetical protein